MVTAQLLNKETVPYRYTPYIYIYKVPDVSSCTASTFSPSALTKVLPNPKASDFPILWFFSSDALFAELYNPGAKDAVDVPPPPVQMIVPPLIPPPAGPPIDELIQQSQWNLQQQEQHMHSLRQVQNMKDNNEMGNSNLTSVSFYVIRFFQPGLFSSTWVRVPFF